MTNLFVCNIINKKVGQNAPKGKSGAFKWVKYCLTDVKNTDFQEGGYKMSGSFDHTLDGKGRLTLPARIREKMSAMVHVTNSFDGQCLYAFSDDEWNVFTAHIADADFEISTLLERYFLANAMDCEIDGNGRILIPQKLREKVGISKDVTILALSQRLEIWDTERWNAFNNFDSDRIFNAMKEAKIKLSGNGNG